MSNSIYKVEYECDCGVNYGSCGAKCAVILVKNNTTDIYSLYHTDAHKYSDNREPKTTRGGLQCFEEEYLAALEKAIKLKETNGQTLTEKEKSVIFSNKV